MIIEVYPTLRLKALVKIDLHTMIMTVTLMMMMNHKYRVRKVRLIHQYILMVRNVTATFRATNTMEVTLINGIKITPIMLKADLNGLQSTQHQLMTAASSAEGTAVD